MRIASFKSTLNLPKTDFPMRLSIAEEQKLSAFIPFQQPKNPQGSFHIHDGPPFANGDIHLGHVFNKTVKDVANRFALKQGKSVSFRPGFDCHGLPIESVARFYEPVKVETDDEFTGRCRAIAADFVARQTSQFQRFGIGGDWNNRYATYDPAYEQNVRNIYQTLKDKGLIEKDLRPVHWSVEHQSAMASAELEYLPIKQNSVYVAFDLVGSDQKLLIWTTTPWSLPGNQLVAMREDILYALVQTEKGKFWVADKQRENLFPNSTVNELRPGSAFVGLCYHMPFRKMLGLIVSADFVKDDAGTGIVHIAPAHGLDDYYVGLREKIPVYCPITRECLYDSTTPDWLAGKHVRKGEKLILDHLSSEGVLLKTETIEHDYPHDWRSGRPTITIATEQIFVALDKPFDGGGTLRERSISALDNVEFKPEFGRARLIAMLKNRPDWCISRQRRWGIKIPGENDIFDVWFESGSSWKTDDQITDAYIEGHDQYRGWFQHSLLLSVACRGVAPFKKIVAHGFIVGPDGRKLSKRDPDYVKAVEEVERVSADVIRLWVCSVDFTDEVRCSPKILADFGEKYAKIRNTIRYLHSNIGDFDGAPRDPQRLSLDSWIRDRALDLEATVKEAMERFEFHRAVQAIYNFCVTDISAIYANAMKDRLYCEESTSDLRRTAQTTMYGLLAMLNDLLEPIIPITIHESRLSQVFSNLFVGTVNFKRSMMDDGLWSQVMQLRSDALQLLDSLKKVQGVNKATDAEVIYRVPDDRRQEFEAIGVDLEDMVGCGYHSVVASDAWGVDVIDRRNDYYPCKRSWKRRPDVGEDHQFMMLSSRDAQAVRMYQWRNPDFEVWEPEVV